MANTATLWEVAVISRVSKNDADSGSTVKMIMAPKPVIAATENEAILVATQDAPELKGVDFQRVETLVRPFRS